MVAPLIGQLQPGSVVVVPFPFSDLSGTKLRPALLVASADRGDWICAQITSNPYADPTAIELTDSDFDQGSLQRVSYVRPGKLFTANQILFRRVAGRLNSPALARVHAAIAALFAPPPA